MRVGGEGRVWVCGGGGVGVGGGTFVDEDGCLLQAKTWGSCSGRLTSLESCTQLSAWKIMEGL